MTESLPPVDDQAQLSRIEEQLRRPDYVLEPKCVQTIIQYIKAGGLPQTCVELLVDGYTGG